MLSFIWDNPSRTQLNLMAGYTGERVTGSAGLIKLRPRARLVHSVVRSSNCSTGKRADTKRPGNEDSTRSHKEPPLTKLNVVVNADPLLVHGCSQSRSVLRLPRILQVPARTYMQRTTRHWSSSTTSLKISKASRNASPNPASLIY